VTDFDIDTFAREFIRVYNEPESDVRRFYSEDLVWHELPGGRSGGQQDLFAALAGVRDVLTDLKITDMIRTYSKGSIGILEDNWRATIRADGSETKAMQGWLWEFDENSMIVRQHDYFMPITDGPMAYEERGE
jgi:ketosteroid isomerase-like protein